MRDIACGWIREKDRVLFVSRPREPWKGYYGPSGGGLEQGEGLKDAVAREVEEETGLKVDVKEKIATFTVKYKSFPPVKMHVFRCEVVGGKLRAESAGHEAFWVSVEDALKMRIPPFVRDLMTGASPRTVYKED